MIGSRVTLPDEAMRVGSYAAIPRSPRRGVVVLHEMFGPQPEIERVVERFAEAGYAAVAPDLYGEASRIKCLTQALVAMRRGEGPQIDQIRSARAWLCRETALAVESVGLIGFCMGGGFALAAGRGWGAVSTNYGYVPAARLLRGIGPTIGCYGGRDRFFGANGAKLEARLRPLGVEVETHTFPEVAHAFLTDGDYSIPGALSGPWLYSDYRPDVAEEGWRRILAFFEKHLAQR